VLSHSCHFLSFLFFWLSLQKQWTKFSFHITYLYKIWISILALKQAFFKAWYLLTWCPEYLSFSYRLCSSQHRPNYGINIMLRQSNFIPGILFFRGRTCQLSCMVFSTWIHIFSMSSTSGARGGQQISSTLACSNNHSWNTQELWVEQWSCWKWITPLEQSSLEQGTIIFQNVFTLKAIWVL
jgi:hypothetical protein